MAVSVGLGQQVADVVVREGGRPAERVAGARVAASRVPLKRCDVAVRVGR